MHCAVSHSGNKDVKGKKAVKAKKANEAKQDPDDGETSVALSIADNDPSAVLLGSKFTGYFLWGPRGRRKQQRGSVAHAK